MVGVVGEGIENIGANGSNIDAGGGWWVLCLIEDKK